MAAVVAGIMTQGHLTKLYEIIRELMDATFEADQREELGGKLVAFP